MDKLINAILNKKEEYLFSIATVTSLSPFTIKFPPDTTSIPCIPTTSLVNIAVNSRVVVIRYKKQFIAINVISDFKKLSDYVVKASSDTIYNTTTLSDDSELTLTLPANGVYSLELVLYLDGTSGTPDCKVAYNTSNVTIKGYRTSIGPGANTSSVYNADAVHMNSRNFTQIATYGIVNAGWGTVFEKSIVETSSSDGSITIQHAQNVASAENIYVRSGSWFSYTRLDYN